VPEPVEPEWLAACDMLANLVKGIATGARQQPELSEHLRAELRLRAQAFVDVLDAETLKFTIRIH
jgi:hypothetical protein